MFAARGKDPYLTWTGVLILMKGPVVAGCCRTSYSDNECRDNTEGCDRDVTAQIQLDLIRCLGDATEKRQHGAFRHVQCDDPGDYACNCCLVAASVETR